MNIIKLQCMNEEAAINCENKLSELGVKQKRLGSAVVVLVTMHNANKISGITHGFKAHAVASNDYDEKRLLS